MKVLRLTLILLLFFFFYNSFNSNLVFSEDDKVLVSIGKKYITNKELNAAIDRLPPSMKDIYQTSTSKEDFLRELVRIEVFSKEAKAMGLDKNKSFKDSVERVMKTLLAGEYTKKEIIAKATISDKEAKKFYENNLSEFKEPEKIKASQIAIGLPADGQPDVIAQKEALVKGIQERISKGEDFISLAKEFSEDPFKGEPDYYGKGAFIPEIEDEIFNLDVGQVSPILKVKDALLLIKVFEKIPERTLTFEETKSSIIERLKNDKLIEIFSNKEKELFSKYNVVFHSQDSKESGNIDISGQITKVIHLKGGSINIIVKDEKGSEASVTITPATKILKRDKEGLKPSSAKNIKVGKFTEIIFSGPAMLTYPVQANAKEVFIIENPKK